MLDNQFQRVLRSIYDELGTPLAQKAKALLDDGNLRGLFALKIDPRDYHDSESFWLDNQTVDLVRKLQVPGNRAELDRAALDTFFECERGCHLTNIRLNKFLLRVYDTPEDLVINDFVGRCRSFIKKVLGPLPSYLVPKFGKGSTYNDRGNLITVPDKMSSILTSTHLALAYRAFVDMSAWGRSHYDDVSRQTFSFFDPEIVRGNRFTTVEKDNSKRRGICIEPKLNVCLQLPIGLHIKQRLKNVCLIDLWRNQEKHREWACSASRTGSHATIDLSNASDTISKELVKLLLPACWWELLNDLRSPYTLLPDGKWCRLEKFSSMGNGFTFELETLIFASILHALGCEVGVDTLVYGDDMIVPKDKANAAICALRFFGFTPNEKKTFIDGPFRESCGGDYFNGVNVRSHFIEELPTEPVHWFALLNGLLRSSRGADSREYRFYTSRKRILDCIPTKLRRLTGPEIFGDSVIHSDDFSLDWELYEGEYTGLARLKGLIPYTPIISYREGGWLPDVQLACALYGCSSDGVSERDTILGYRVGWLYYS